MRRDILIICLALLTGCETAPVVKIDSFRVINTSPKSVDIELIVSNKGSNGDICLGVLAKSKDGSVRSEEAFYPAISVGQNIRIVRQVTRPHGLDKHQTDYLLVEIIPCGKKLLFTKKFDWLYVWPDISTGEKRDNKSEDLGNTNPWFALLQNLNDEDYSALDTLVSKWNTSKERDNNGEWKVDNLRSTLYYVTQNSKWRDNIAQIKKWRHFNPMSPWAAIAEAKYWSSYAWHIRGCTDCQDVDPVAMKLFFEDMQRAEKVLVEAKSFGSDNPLWYVTYLEIAIDTKRDEEFIQKLFNEGIRKFPDYRQLYVVMSYQWTPLYGEKADWEKVDELANYAIKLTSETDGMSNYAWLYTQISFQLGVQVDIFKESFVSWPKMRDSFNDLITRYPSAENLNDFAVFACRAGDKETYFNIRPKVQGHVVPNRWPSNFSIDLCDHRYMQYS